MDYQLEAERLKASVWPNCNYLAENLAVRGQKAIEALQYAARSKTHHVRAACLHALYRIDQSKGKELAKHLLFDRAYAVRADAADILGIAKEPKFTIKEQSI